MWRISTLLLGCLLLCCACNPIPTSPPTLTIIPTFTATIEFSPAEITPTSTPQPTSTPHTIESMWLDFVTPISGDRLSSPIRFRGRTNIIPSNREIIVRLYDQNWNLLNETTTMLQGEIGQAGTFSGEITVSGYTGPAILVAESKKNGANIATRITIEP